MSIKICRTVSYAIPPQNQLVMRKTYLNLLWPPRKSVFKVVVGSQIMVPPTIPHSQWHSRYSNPWAWLWYHLSDRELCYSTSKSIGNKEDILKSFMTFDITLLGSVFKFLTHSKTKQRSKINKIHLKISTLHKQGQFLHSQVAAKRVKYESIFQTKWCKTLVQHCLGTSFCTQFFTYKRVFWTKVKYKQSEKKKYSKRVIKHSRGIFDWMIENELLFKTPSSRLYIYIYIYTHTYLE